MAPLASVHAAGDDEDAADRIIISGASGGFAGETIDALLGRGVPFHDLILVTRTPEKLASFASQGAAVRAGDFDKPDSLPAAFKGGSRMLLISTDAVGKRIAQHTAAINAARKAGVRHIVYTSFINPVEDNPAAVARDHRLTEETLERSGIAYTILRNQRYSDGLVAQSAQAIAVGQIVTNAGTGMWAPVTRRDCAAAAAVVLTTAGHDRKIYDITGPDLINERQLATLLAEVTGKRLGVVQLDDASYVARLVQAGMPEPVAKTSASFGTATRENFLNIRNEALQILLGRKPTTVRELLMANKTRLLTP